MNYSDLHRLVFPFRSISRFTSSWDPALPKNVLIGEPGALVYRFTLDNQVRDVKSSATVWIPAGVKHSANALSGEGHYLCLILADSKEVFRAD